MRGNRRGIGVEMLVESIAPIQVRMLGRLTVRRRDVNVELPASRKSRALLAYLALAPAGVARSRLCELLWEVPNNPRGELRWSLSKVRRLVDEPGRRRIHTESDIVKLDVTDCFVDANEVTAATQSLDTLELQRLKTLAGLFAGDFLHGLEMDDSPVFENWLTAQRRRLRAVHVSVLEELVKRVHGDEALAYLEQWAQLAPFDVNVHQLLLRALLERNRVREAEEHLSAVTRHFQNEGFDAAAIGDVWRSVRAASSSITVDVRGNSGVAAAEPRRASVAIMPFSGGSAEFGVRGSAADALAHDVITKLAKLRSLFIIAQGSVFALSERGVAPDEAARMLGVDYVGSGSVRIEGNRFTVTVELAETQTGRIIWAEVFKQSLDGAFQVPDEIADRIVASIAGEIEASERNRAVLKPPNSLDAWQAHHRGLWHMYRFNKLDNDRAQQFFAMAVRLDPTFARAHAGLSFTYFQNAFQGWEERAPQIRHAYQTAAQSLMADDRDPAAHWAMGRAQWLRGEHEQCLDELEQAIALSPNFALGHYTLAFVQSQGGDPHNAIASSDRSRQLSPFDPLLFGMLGARAMALVRIGRFEEAAYCGVQAAARPNAHAHILAIAALCLGLAGRAEEARRYLAAIHETLPHYRLADFLAAMHFEPEAARVFREAAKRIGLN